MVGGSIGIFSVILMLALGNGVKGYMNKQIMSHINPTTIQVAKKVSGDVSSEQNLEMTKAVRDRIQKVNNVTRVVPGYQRDSGVQVKYRGKSQQVKQFQTWNKTEKVSDIKTGSRPEKNEILLKRETAQKFAKNYKSLVGQSVNFSIAAVDNNGQPITVTRNMRVSGIINFGKDTVNYNSLKAMYEQSGATLRSNFVTVSTKNIQTTKRAQNEIKGMKVNGKLAFSITGVGAMLGTVNTYISLAFYILAGIAAISLLVSAIMIIVVLYISVSERTKEIGVLRALGVRRRDIRNLFVSEAFFIGLFSATLGVVIAGLAQLLINHFAVPASHFSIIQMSVSYAVFGLFTGVIISLVSAMAPAHQASKLDPIESLSVE